MGCDTGTVLISERRRDEGRRMSGSAGRPHGEEEKGGELSLRECGLLQKVPEGEKN